MAKEKKLHKQHRTAGNVAAYITLIIISITTSVP